jgi:hypothetical protein
MTTMYVQTRTGGWATHLPTSTGTTGRKKKTNIPLYTLEQALALGYEPPVKTPYEKNRFQTGKVMKVHIEDRPTAHGDFIRIGTATFDGSDVPLGFSKAPPTTLKTYRKKDSDEYVAHRLTVNDKGKWVMMRYENKVGFTGLPLQREKNKDGYHTAWELADHLRHKRAEIFDSLIGAVQDHIVALSVGPIKIKTHGREREVLAAPEEAKWMQHWLNRRIEITQKSPELYGLYQEWKTKRFPGDEQAFSRLAAWAVQDSHLVKIEESHRKNWTNRRNDQYKKLAYILVQQAKDGGSIYVNRPELRKEGVEASKPDLMTEEHASSQRKFISSAATSTFILFLKLCATREGVNYKEEEREKPVGKRERSGGAKTPDLARMSCNL